MPSKEPITKRKAATAKRQSQRGVTRLTDLGDDIKPRRSMQLPNLPVERGSRGKNLPPAGDSGPKAKKE